MATCQHVDAGTHPITYVLRTTDKDKPVRYWRALGNTAITIDVGYDGKIRGVEINWQDLQRYIDFKQADYLARKETRHAPPLS